MPIKPTGPSSRPSYRRRSTAATVTRAVRDNGVSLPSNVRTTCSLTGLPWDSSFSRTSSTRDCPLPRCQLQDPHVLPIRSSRLLLVQGVIGTPPGHTGVHVLPIPIAGERSRLADQPVNHVPIIDPMLRLTMQPFHLLHQRAGVPHL